MSEKQLGLGHQIAIKLAFELHAHSLDYAHTLVTTLRALGNRNLSHSQDLNPGACVQIALGHGCKASPRIIWRRKK